MKIGIIGGTGAQGLGIAKRLAIAGEDVIVGSRKEEKALKIVEETNEEIKEYNPKKLTGMANEDAAANADVLILTVPLEAQSATLKTIKENAKGKILLDATVPLETAIGGPVSNVLHINPGSAAERAAKILKDVNVKVIAAFNNISNSHLANLSEPIDCDCLICGDDEEAKQVATEIIEKIPDLKAIDIGPLNKAHLIESITPLLIGMNIKYKSHYGGFRITGIDFD
ncbi:NADPH-dependent F420 reductase [uncultured Methanobrevibacter sp.]|uniref:NADPH-dependent F420 reductase n=1 Tax=uncultured Methanobrevibacter sp. TaxID=253161 RepID=UPI002628B2E8|nr:NADPH-dependent F420 reductase [uncultured Methanobrevibacter sp.]